MNMYSAQESMNHSQQESINSKVDWIVGEKQFMSEVAGSSFEWPNCTKKIIEEAFEALIHTPFNLREKLITQISSLNQ